MVKMSQGETTTLEIATVFKKRARKFTNVSLLYLYILCNDA